MFGITHYIDCRLCHYDKTNGRNAQIKETFNKTLNVYPTKNLDDFTIKKAFEIKNLIKEIKGLGLIHSKMIIETNGGAYGI